MPKPRSLPMPFSQCRSWGNGFIVFLFFYFHLFVESALVSQDKGVGAAFDEGISLEILKGVDGFAVDAEHDVALAHAGVVGLVVAANESD